MLPPGWIYILALSHWHTLSRAIHMQNSRIWLAFSLFTFSESPHRATAAPFCGIRIANTRMFACCCHRIGARGWFLRRRGEGDGGWRGWRIAREGSLRRIRRRRRRWCRESWAKTRKWDRKKRENVFLALSSLSFAFGPREEMERNRLESPR